MKRRLARILAYLLVRSILLSTCSGCLVGVAWSTPFKQPDRKVKAVVLGGSLSKYYRGNYGQFLEYGCKNLEVVNRAKVGAGGNKLLKRMRSHVLRDRSLMKAMKGGEKWLIFQGGLNSIYAPESTNANLARLFKLAKDRGFRTMALTLTPWGDDSDKRFRGWEGLFYVRATRLVNRFLLGKLSPDEALGRKAKNRPHSWQRGELPDISVDVYNSPLRDSRAKRRDKAVLTKSFRRSRYKRRTKQFKKLLRQASNVPRGYLKRKYRDFDHIHPNSTGHRILAQIACKKAPSSWGCDCEKIRRSVFKGRVRDRKP
ncbi:MAG: hypothetical protein CMH53_07240 [Myxococcales bacterium]|nr:hypothetical protein [Myxococcales bacterium]